METASAARILKGIDAVASMNEAMKKELAEMAAYCLPDLWTPPCLAVFRVGEKPDDLSYEKGVQKRFEALGLRMTVYAFPEDISSEEFLAELQGVNENPDVNGILIFRPLPAHIDTQIVAKTLDSGKDVDGISPVNMAKVFAGDLSGFAPCTAQACIAMLDFAAISLAGKRVIVAGRSLVVGKPLSMLLLGRDATVTLCHSKTQDLPQICREADILISCIGKAKMIDAGYVRPGAAVIDVGINVDKDGKLCGDVDFASVSSVAGAITPVPGGIGSVTTSVLARHLIQASKIRRKACLS